MNEFYMIFVNAVGHSTTIRRKGYDIGDAIETGVTEYCFLTNCSRSVARQYIKFAGCFPAE